MKTSILATSLVASIFASSTVLADIVIEPGGEFAFAKADGYTPPQSEIQFGAQCLSYYDDASGNMMSAVFGALPNARGSCVVAEFNDFTIPAGPLDSALLTQISGRVEENGFLALVGMGNVKSEVLVEVIDRGDDLATESDDVILMTHHVFEHEIVQGLDVGLGVGMSADLGSATVLQAGIELGAEFGIPLRAEVISERADFGFQVLLPRGRSYRVRTVVQANFKLGVSGGFAIASFHADRDTLDNLFQTPFWLQTSSLPIAGADLANVNFPLGQSGTLFVIPQIWFPGWSITIDWFVDSTTFTIIPPMEILPETHIQNPLPYANPTVLLQALGLFTRIADIINSPLVGLASVAGFEDPIPDIGTRVKRIDVAVEHDVRAEEVRFLVERNLAFEGQKNPVASFQLPAALGGQLELAREIVVERMTALAATGVGTKKSAKALADGDEKYAKGKYKAAFKSYGEAYVALTD